MMLGGGSFDSDSKEIRQGGFSFISLLPVIQKIYIRALQSAVRRERNPHETNILG